MQNYTTPTEKTSPEIIEAQLPIILYSKYGVRVEKIDRGFPIGIEYNVSAGHLQFNTSVRPDCTLANLNRLLNDYGQMKQESESGPDEFTPFEVVEQPERNANVHPIFRNFLNTIS